MSLNPKVKHWIELSRRYRTNPVGPRVLQIVKVGKTHFFVHERLCQIRNVENVDNCLDFESDSDLLVFVMQHGGILS